MKYVITNIDKEAGVVELTVTFDDNKTYDKRMMAPMDSDEAVNKAIQKWLFYYAPLREAEKTDSYDPTKLEGKTVSVTQEDLAEAAKGE